MHGLEVQDSVLRSHETIGPFPGVPCHVKFLFFGSSNKRIAASLAEASVTLRSTGVCSRVGGVVVVLLPARNAPARTWRSCSRYCPAPLLWNQDPLLRDAALAQIHNFGQTPSLVLKKPHPPREVPPVVRISTVDGSRSADPAAVEWHTPLTPPLCIVGAPDAVALKAVSLTSPGSAWQASSGGGVGDARIVRDKIVGVGLGAILYPRSLDKYLRYGGPSCGLSFFQVGRGLDARG